MADEIVTTTATLPGIMEKDQADFLAQFLIKSRLFGAIWTESTEGKASVVQFPSIAKPAPVAVGTEADDVANTALTIASKTATIKIYPEVTRVSKLAMQGGNNVPDYVKMYLSNDVASGVDKAIAAQFLQASFTTTLTGAASLTNFEVALDTLDNTGYSGTKICVMSTKQMRLVLAGLGTKYVMTKNEEYFGRGYVGNLMDCELFTLPESWMVSDTQYQGIMMFKEYGVAAGYHPPIVQMTMIEDHEAVEFGAMAFLDVTMLHADGAAILDWTV